MARAQRETEAIEDALSAAPDVQVEAALELAEEDHQASVGFQIAEAEAAARRREMDDEAARQFVEEDQMLVDDNLNLPVSPTIAEPIPEAKRMRRRYVCRNGTWLLVKRLRRFHVGEKIYVKNSAGEFEVAGHVNQNGQPPVIYLED